MKMKMSRIAVLALLVLLLQTDPTQMRTAEAAVSCDPLQLSPCANAITSSTAPSPTCCSKLKEQKPCLCQYLKNPNLQKLVNSPNAKKVANTCGIPFPTC